MSSIQILPDVVIDQIAAGEIIERPASVAKELVENSLDAGATQVILHVENGGRSLLQVTDNGSGIDASNLPIAIQRFATSKIRDADDLNLIATYGFRGEALPSIASVSEMSITSNMGGGAHSLQIKGGAVGPLQEAVFAKGTKVQIENLFYNVPARQKFLKKAPTESRKIHACIQAFAIAYPGISFQLVQEGRTLLSYAPRQLFDERLLEIYGETYMSETCPLDHAFYSGKVRGRISKPSYTRRDRTGIKTFVNGRLVQTRILNFVISKFFKDKIPHGLHPFVILMLDIEPAVVDVNVHPAKMEVRFHREGEIIAACLKAFEKALIGNLDSFIKNPFTAIPSQPSVGTPEPNSPHDLPGLRQVVWGSSFRVPIGESGSPGRSSEEIFEGTGQSASVNLQEIPETNIQLIGQIKDSYLLLQMEDALVIMDQHAAHERVLYEVMIRDKEGKKPSVQALLLPQTIDLSPEDHSCIEEYKVELEALGFSIQPFGGYSIKVDAVPAHVGSCNLERYFQGLVVYLSDRNREDPHMEKCIRGVCRQSVMFGDSMNHAEQVSLVQQLFGCQNPYSCPHGRPTFFRLTWNEINRKLGRE